MSAYLISQHPAGCIVKGNANCPYWFVLLWVYPWCSFSGLSRRKSPGWALQRPATLAEGHITRSVVNKAVAALANKHARMAWALVNQKTVYLAKW